MKICKVKPSRADCRICLETQSMCGVIDDCQKCKNDPSRDGYELIDIGHTFWLGDYALVERNGEITRVDLERVHDIRRV